MCKRGVLSRLTLGVVSTDDGQGGASQQLNGNGLSASRCDGRRNVQQRGLCALEKTVSMGETCVCRQIRKALLEHNVCVCVLAESLADDGEDDAQERGE